MQCCWGSLQSAQALCWQPADHGRRLGIFSSGLHRIRGSVSLIYNIRKQRSLSHTHTHTHTLPSNPDLCLRLGTALCPGGGQRVAEAKCRPCPPMGSWAPPPPRAGGHSAGACAASAVSPSGEETGWNTSGCVSGWVASLFCSCFTH